MIKAIGFGPWIGDFESEIITFRPYIKWVSEVSEINYNDFFLYTHENRSFMYDWIPEDNIFHVYQQLTRSELEQKGFTHNNVKQKDFNLLVKIFKENIVEARGYSKKDIDIIHLSYIKNPPIYSVYQKSFVKIPVSDINISEEYKNKVVYIPHDEEREDRAEEIYDFLVDEYDAIIAGDLKINLSWDNIILNNIDYFENGFKYLLKILDCAKLVVCPASYWTYLCNLQNVPVFSYGPTPGLYRPGGIYYLNNEKSMVISAVEDTPAKQITSMVKYFKDKL